MNLWLLKAEIYACIFSVWMAGKNKVNSIKALYWFSYAWEKLLFY